MKDSSGVRVAGRAGQTPRAAFRHLLAAAVSLVLVALPAAAFASDVGEGATVPSVDLPLSALKEAQAAQSSLARQLTDADAATELPHRDLDRAEALDLLEGVFEPVLQSPAGGFDSLDVKKFLSDSAALVFPGADESSSALTVGGEAEGQHEQTPVLLESSVPLRVDGPDGSGEVVDLSLEHAGDQVRSVAPIEPVAIPEELGEGIEFPGSGVGIELVGAPAEREPSIIQESVAAYPNVDTDTDFAVAPTPTGVETLTTLRSPDAPRTQSFHLSLPSGASLIETEHGGAEILRAGESILKVMPASAIDATGASVPVSMTVSGDTLTVTVTPQVGTAYPILVDPLYEGFSWKNEATTNYSGWTPFSNSSTILNGYGKNWGAGYNGLYTEAQAAYHPVGDMATWTHTVPRYAEERAKNQWSTAFFIKFTDNGLYLVTSGGLPSPFVYTGIFNPETQKWAGNVGNEQVWSYPGNAAPFYNATLNFENGTPGNRDKHAQIAYGIGLAVSEAGWLGAPRAAYLGAATAEIGDEDLPGVANAAAPSQWVNQSPAGPITVNAQDTGLGVKSVTFSATGLGEQTVTRSCGGQTGDPCPSEWEASLVPSSAALAAMPQGTNNVSITAKDVLGNATAKAATAQIKVDHTKPTLAFSGAMTEQGTLGTTLPSYALKYEAKDGTEASPQSGVASTEVKIDGKAAEAKYAPGCTTKNCAITKEWTLTSSAYAVGSHTIEVIATDAVGLSTAKTLTVNLAKDGTAPTVKTEGAFFSGPEGWLEQKSYSATVKATDPGGYGLTSLVLKLDGTAVQSKSQSCTKGGCEASFTKSLNMALYDGGAHTAEVIATDGASNTTSKTWTINVDPSGSIPPDEAAETLEAMEGTEPETDVVAPTAEVVDAAERAYGNEPALEAKESHVVSVGVAAKSTIQTGKEGGIVIEAPEGAIEVTPVASVGFEPEIVEDVAAVTPNTTTGSDTIVRPKYNGLLAFQSIREPTAPETYSWEVALLPGQTLEALNGQSAAVFYEDGTEAMLIEAMPAHDAVGHAVPTSLSVNGKEVVSLTIAHKNGGYVYPILGGPSYEVGYSTVEVIIPPPPPQGPSEAQAFGSPGPIAMHVSAPVPVAAPDNEDDEASVSGGTYNAHKIYVDMEQCLYEDPVFDSGCYWAEQHIENYFFFNYHWAWRKDSQPHPSCPSDYHGGSVDLTYCDWSGAKKAKYGGGYHITSQVFWVYNAGFAKPMHMTVEMFGSGHAYAVDSACVCNPRT